MLDRGGVPSGQFTWDTVTDEWRWSDAVFAIHGYRPHQVVPSVEIVLQHKAEPGRSAAEEILESVRAEDRHFSNYHQIVDTAGNERVVFSVGTSRVRRVADTGELRRVVTGYMTDLSDPAQRAANEAVVAARQSSAAIQQSLGLLMGALALPEEQAMALLRRYSSHANVRVADLADRFVRAAAAGLFTGEAHQLLVGALHDPAYAGRVWELLGAALGIED